MQSTSMPTPVAASTRTELGEQLAGLSDLTLLPPFLGIVALVVAAEEQDDLVAIEVHKDTEEDLLTRPGTHFIARCRTCERPHPRHGALGTHEGL